ncbi:MAG: FAD-dependent oxidoreductase [Dongiaceae bacterium]
MPRDPRYDILFESVKIGPKTAKNRFYQVPHCSGMGWAWPQTLAAMRGMKAAGGWAVVNTEYCSIHPSSEDAPYPYCRLWSDDDVRDQRLMTEAVHEHGALAGVELWHGGYHTHNRYSREGLIAPGHQPGYSYDPVQARPMDKDDIRNLRRWQAEAAKRAVCAGFDIVYVYAGHGYLPVQFLSRRFNQRGDEYGGSLENRARLLKEMILDTREAIGPDTALAVRLMVDEFHGPDGITSEREGREVLALLGELPDLWDVQLGHYVVDSRSSRFVKEGAQEPYVAFVKQVTSKPVVGVGRFTSPDAMVSQIRRGILDFIGAARPSIADPFLPAKIEEGRLDDIRECIGCNICVASNGNGVPLRCTQNPTMGEEWRRGWHPEVIAPKDSEDSVLIVGAGPAGLECARALGQRGYAVHLAEATTELGGRVVQEAKLPGLGEWIRVRDYRIGQIQRLANVNVYRDSRLTAADVREFGAAHVVIATGAAWRRDGVGRTHPRAIPGSDRADVFTPEDVFAGAAIAGPVVVFDDDHYYMGGVIAEELRRRGLEVTLLTPAGTVSTWTEASLEQPYIQAQLIEAGIAVVVGHSVAAVGDGEIEITCAYTDHRRRLPARSAVMVTSRLPNTEVYDALVADRAALAAAGIRSVTRIGDCLNPGIIAAAVHSGHRYARELDAPPAGDLPFRVEHIRHEESGRPIVRPSTSSG